MTVLELINITADFFKKKGVPSPKLDAELLIASALKINRLQLYIQFEREMEEITLDKLRPLVKRRGDREPLQYILGDVEWANLRLKVDRRCLVPRNETEELWEKIVDEFKIMNFTPKTILDLGTGSGALALALKKSFPAAVVTAVERNGETLALALENARALELEVNFVEGSWYNHLTEGAKFDLIVSNPPYLTTEELETSQPEVKQYEPKEALTAPDDGFADLDFIIRGSKNFLTPIGQLWLETGVLHAGRVKTLAKELGFEKIEIFKDHRERSRFARLA